MFKKMLAVLLATVFLLTACGSDLKVKTPTGDTLIYETYGLFNVNEVRKDNMEYRLIIGNAVWGVLLFETIIAPVYVFGFSLYEPVGLKGVGK